MPNVVVVGTQWGDEGKGRIVDLIAEKVDIVVRYQGGNNAGHTIVTDGKSIVLHHLPSGIIREGKLSLIGNGVVVDPKIFLEEVSALQKAGYSVGPSNLKISDKVHVIMPYHKKIDISREKLLGNKKIGTTGRGIGPVYEDKYARRGIKISDIIEPDSLYNRLKAVLNERNLYLTKVLESDALEFDEIYNEYIEYGKILKPFVCDVSKLLYESIGSNKDILFEGAQGTLLDVDFGTYPYVTSSNAGSGGVFVGTGINPKSIDYIVGVTKAYTTRVGEGPFPTEESGDLEERLRVEGGEYGATTGRSRRCGWLDIVALNYSARINGISAFALTKLDVLSGFKTIKICTSYKYNGNILNEFPSNIDILSKCVPVFEELEGWEEDLSNFKSIKQLPSNAIKFINRIEQLTNIPTWLVSVGPSREMYFEINNLFVN
ncbi:MAG: adenylosuccinate synthase [Candidatus Dadabacteria bacterium]|nr:adenylosuccinate synthase [Candidatus Dadabacteria bacterium]NIQ12935.1 adenylosuccinate synthase [Candidatus Dadabacteria bacterium]